MLRKLLGILIVLVLFTGVMLAAESKGKIKEWNKGTLTVTVGDKDVEYKVGKDAKVYLGSDEQTGKDRGKALKGAAGSEVTIIYEKDGDKITVKEVKIKK